MKNIILSSALAFIALFSLNTALAQHPHWVKGNPTFAINGTDVCFSGKIAGLGSNQTYTICLTDGSAQGTVDCRNNGGQIVATKTKANLTLNASSFTGTTDAGGNLILSGSDFCSEVSIDGNPCPNPNWTPEIRSGTISNVDGTLKVYLGSTCSGTEITGLRTTF